MNRRLLPLTIAVFGLLLAGCGGDAPPGEPVADHPAADAAPSGDVAAGPRTDQAPRITFVELGSVKCVPCREMQPVMAAIEKKYGGQVEVIFYDIWKADQEHYQQEYDVRIIPTQVFLDRDGREILRHEGFFPEAEIDAFLRKQGLSVVEAGSAAP